MEIRTWKTKHRGLLYLHASKQVDKECPFYNPNVIYKTGQILGSCEILDCMEFKTDEAFAAFQEVHLNPVEWFSPNHVGWQLIKVKILPYSIPIPGQLGLWEWTGAECYSPM